jgi:hypothetical protein
MPEAQPSINNNVDKPIVDIDTSGPSVNVAVEEKKEEDKVEVQEDTTVQEVNTTQQSKDELDTVSEGVQKRIDRLTWKVREAERREKAATEYAKSVQQRLKENETKLTKLDDGYINEFKNRVESQISTAKDKLKLAINAGDAEKQAEAQAILAQLAVDQQQVQKFENSKPHKEQQKEVPVNPQTAAPVQQPVAPPPDPKAQAWAQKNSWFGKDDAMTYTAYSLHKKLTEQEGFDPNSDEYYSEIDKRIRNEFPHKFGENTNSSDRPVQAVASASRTSSKSGRKTVKLSPSQVAIAKKLGVSLQEYAKYVKE